MVWAVYMWLSIYTNFSIDQILVSDFKKLEIYFVIVQYSELYKKSSFITL